MRTGRQVSRLLNISGAAAEQEDTGAKTNGKGATNNRYLLPLEFRSSEISANTVQLSSQ